MKPESLLRICVTVTKLWGSRIILNRGGRAAALDEQTSSLSVTSVASEFCALFWSRTLVVLV